MKRLVICTLAVLFAVPCFLTTGDAADKPEKKESGYRVLMVTQSRGFKHGSVSRKKEGDVEKLAPAEQALAEQECSIVAA